VEGDAEVVLQGMAGMLSNLKLIITDALQPAESRKKIR
jgi:hypothetical protein